MTNQEEHLPAHSSTSLSLSVFSTRMQYVQAMISGLLMGFAFQPTPLSWVALCGFVPLFRALHSAKNYRQSLLLIYWGMFAFHGASNWWVSSWQAETDPYLMASGIILWLVHPFFFALPLMAFQYIRITRSASSAYMAFPFLWTAFEWLHSLTDLSYPWQALGYTQVGFLPLIQIADIMGVWGVSFCVASCNALIARWSYEYHGAETLRSLFVTNDRLRQRLLAGTFCFATAVMVVIGYGGRRMGLFNPEQWFTYSNKARIAIVQPNINPWGKWSDDADAQIIKHTALIDSLIQADQRRPDCVLWSENAVPLYVLSARHHQRFDYLSAWSRHNEFLLIAGAPTDTIYAPQAQGIPPSARTAITVDGVSVRYDSFNSAVGFTSPISSSTAVVPFVQVHRKARLTPFAERLPFADALTFAMKWMEWGVGISSWQKGSSAMPMRFRVKNLYGDTTQITPYKISYNTVQAIGTVICLESIYPDFVRQFTQNGANVLCILTNDGWFDGTPGPHQHFAIAQMRAVENRRAIARCANTGVSGFILPDGSPCSLLPVQSTHAVQYDVPLFDGQTIYVQYGDWFAKLCTLLAVLSLAGAIIAQWQKKKTSQKEVSVL